MESAVYGGTLGLLGAVGSVAGGTPAALSDTASAGLILGGGALGCGLLVIGLTALALRRGGREERDAAPVRKVTAGAVRQGGGESGRGQRATAGGGRRGGEAGHAAGSDGHDPYPPQPYSPQEPRTHQPFSRPYQVPRQDHHGSTNGHRPPGSSATGFPSTPYSPPDDEG